MKEENRRYMRDLVRVEGRILRKMAKGHQDFTKNFLKMNNVIYKGTLISGIVLKQADTENVFGLTIPTQYQVISRAPHSGEVEDNLAKGVIRPLGEGNLRSWVLDIVSKDNPSKAEFFLNTDSVPIGLGREARSLYARFPKGVQMMKRGFDFATADTNVRQNVNEELVRL